ncbi:MAG: hypothetical protein KA138_11080 [Saprospiraceae bacterium]|nr:hypothetical protein [Saprospiraceae bacterium]
MSNVQRPTFNSPRSSVLWKLLFFAIVAGYCLYYAPFGVNETDGGFLTGLAWQVLNGKTLYYDIVYVRPPLSVWLRALEIQFLPEQFAVLGERWIFYGKVALYSWLGAAVLAKGERRWQLAVFGFVVSAHCYPPMAWHTVDGILFAVMAAFFTHSKQGLNLLIAGTCLFCALLCKQSFYPLLPIIGVFLFLEKEARWKRIGWFFGGFALSFVLFFNYLRQNNLLDNFLKMTSGAASTAQAFQHGILDYFRITPALALPSILFLLPVAWWFWKGRNPRIALVAWSLWLFALVASFAAITWLRQDHTAPIAQSRVMFWVAVICILPSVLRLKAVGRISPSFLLLGISWCASVSWGYNFPMLFTTPWVLAGMEVTRVLEDASKPIRFPKPYRFLLLLSLLFTFRIAHEFVYRDGRRSEMDVHMGSIFPQLSGIYSDQETADLYLDLKKLATKYGPNFKTLPAFPQANYLTKTTPPFPLDWVVNRETNGDNTLIFKDLQEKKPVIFIQKYFRDKIESDPELEVTRLLFQRDKVVEETPHFWVVTNHDL